MSESEHKVEEYLARISLNLEQQQRSIRDLGESQKQQGKNIETLLGVTSEHSNNIKNLLTISTRHETEIKNQADTLSKLNREVSITSNSRGKIDGKSLREIGGTVLAIAVTIGSLIGMFVSLQNAQQEVEQLKDSKGEIVKRLNNDHQRVIDRMKADHQQELRLTELRQELSVAKGTLMPRSVGSR